MNKPTLPDFDLVDTKNGKKVETQFFASDDDWDDYEVVDPRSGKEVEPQPFSTDDDWDDYEVVDPRSGKEVEPQPFASDDDWDDYEVVDPRSGKEVEPQPFASDNDWGDAPEVGEFEQEPTANTVPEEVQSAPFDGEPQHSAEAVLPNAPEPAPFFIEPLPRLIQEVPLLQLRGYSIQAAKNRQTGDWCAFYTAPSGRKYLLKPAPGSATPEVFYRADSGLLGVPIEVECVSTQEVLHVINQYDLVVPAAEGGGNG